MYTICTRHNFTARQPAIFYRTMNKNVKIMKIYNDNYQILLHVPSSDTDALDFRETAESTICI